MGVRKYHNKWRVYAHDKDGNKVQEYHATEEQAQQRYDELTTGKNKICRNKKRHSAAHQDLPVGIEEYAYSGAKPYEHNTYVAIRASIFINGKIKYFMRNFGLSRTREEAVDICLKWRLEQVELIEKSD